MLHIHLVCHKVARWRQLIREKRLGLIVTISSSAAILEMKNNLITTYHSALLYLLFVGCPLTLLPTLWHLRGRRPNRCLIRKPYGMPIPDPFPTRQSVTELTRAKKCRGYINMPGPTNIKGLNQLSYLTWWLTPVIQTGGERPDCKIRKDPPGV